MKVLFILMGAALISRPAYASVLSVSSPNVDQGEWSIETGMSWEKDNDTENDDSREYVFEFGYSPTNFWNTALEFSGDQQGEDTEYVSTAWKNTLQFISQDERFPLSAGLRLQYEKAHLDGDADEVAVRLLFRHQNKIFDSRLNIGVEKEVGSDAQNDIAGDIRTSVRYKWSENLKTSIDYLGDTGSLDNLQGFQDQDHRIGPVLYGSFDDISYEAGYLAGLSNASPDHTLKIAFGLVF